jgi:outer membrane protein assembly factor BamB
MQRFDAGNTAFNPDGSAPGAAVAVRAEIDIAASYGEDYLLADGVVYIHNAAGGNVGAVDLETGDTLWTADLADVEVLPEFVEGDVLVTRANDGTMYVLNRDTGDVQVELSPGRGIGLGFAGDGKWTAPTMDGTLFGGEGGSDDYRWTADVDGIGFRPAIDEERVYLPTIQGISPEDLNLETPTEMDASGRLYAIDRSDGSVEWEVSHDRFGVKSVAVADGSVYWPCADGTLTAYDAETGDERWQFEGREGFNSAVAVTDDAVLAGNDDGRLYGIDRESGEQLGEVGVGERVRGSPVVVGNVVCFGTDNDKAYAYSLETFEVVWEFETEAPVRALTAGDDCVVVGSWERCYVLGPSEEAAVGDDTAENQETREEGVNEARDSEGVDEAESADHRGFLTNDPDSALTFLDDPVTLTWAGIGVSIIGIVMQLFGRQT